MVKECLVRLDEKTAKKLMVGQKLFFLKCAYHTFYVRAAPCMYLYNFCCGL